MLQLLGWSLLAIVVAGGLCALAVVFLPAGEQIAPAVRDEPVWQLPPERGLRADDVDSVRLPVALRGYRFAETDLLLDRLAEEIRTRDLTIARLSQPAGVPTDDPADDPAGNGLQDDAAEPDAAEPDAAEPDGDQLDAAKPDADQLDVDQRD